MDNRAFLDQVTAMKRKSYIVLHPDGTHVRATTTLTAIN